MEYRREIDGLRAIAVVPVVLFHGGFGLFAGGYVGVDVFLVISGYLITSIIIKEQAQGSFTILNFYERRMRRILPALFFVMISCMPFAWAWMAPHQLKDFSQSLVATTLFSSNIFFYLETDYFNELSELAPLLHTWSLAVEEQYYLLFPPFILLTWRLGVKGILTILAMIFVASLGLAQWLSVENPVANFYLLPSRIWELLLGVFVAFYLDANSGHLKKHGLVSSEIPSFVGLVLIVYSIFNFDASTRFPGIWALLPTVGTALIILFATPATIVGKILSLKPIVGFGLISYSLYLWHQPLLAFARIRSLGELDSLTIILLALMSVLMAYVSYKYIESPFRNKNRISRKHILQSAAVFVVIFPSVGVWGHLNDGFLDYKVSKINVELQKFVIDRNTVLQERRIVWNEMLRDSDASFDSQNGRVKVLVLGDSKSQDLYVAFQLNSELFDQFQFRRVRLDDGCMQPLDVPLDNIAGGQGCREEISNLKKSNLLEQADIIILSSTWRQTSNYSVTQFVEHLANEEQQIIVVSTGNFNDLTSLSMIIAENNIQPDALGEFLFQNIRSDRRRTFSELKDSISHLPNLLTLEKLELFCDFNVQTCELFTDEGLPLIYDTGHVTVEGARMLGRKMYERQWLLH